MSGATFDHLKALVVEDNVHMRTLLRSLLTALGIKRVYEAGNGAEAFVILRENSPDMILTDLSMTPVDGIAGHTERHKVEAARDAGVTEFLAKPITAQGLFLRIAEIVERPRPYVRCADYFGPDRRRRADEHYPGPWRRHEDIKSDTGSE